MISTIGSQRVMGTALFGWVLEEDHSAWGPFEQRPEGGRSGSLQSSGRSAFQAEGTQTERTQSERMLETRIALPFRSSLLLVCRTTSL